MPSLSTATAGEEHQQGLLASLGSSLAAAHAAVGSGPIARNPSRRDRISEAMASISSSLLQRGRGGGKSFGTSGAAAAAAAASMHPTFAEATSSAPDAGALSSRRFGGGASFAARSVAGTAVRGDSPRRNRPSLLHGQWPLLHSVPIEPPPEPAVEIQAGLPPAPRSVYYGPSAVMRPEGLVNMLELNEQLTVRLEDGGGEKELPEADADGGKQEGPLAASGTDAGEATQWEDEQDGGVPSSLMPLSAAAIAGRKMLEGWEDLGFLMRPMCCVVQHSHTISLPAMLSST